MHRLPKRKGISAGTVAMTAITGLVILGCVFLYPRLLGETTLRFNAKELAVVFSRSQPEGPENSNAGFFAGSISSSPAPPTAEPVLLTPPATISFRLSAAGSVHIDNAVQKAMTDAAGYHYEDLFALLGGDINADLAVVTLENTVIPSEKLTETNVPADVLSALRSSGFQAICLGYGGILNSGLAGLAATQSSVTSAGMIPYGVYASAEKRSALTFTNVNGLSVVLLSYQDDISAAGAKKATNEEQAFAFEKPILSAISNDIRKAKAKGAQIVVVSLSWGKKGASAPTQSQRELAQGIADSGADIIIGTRSGVLQPVEILTSSRSNGISSQTLCAYSLGNLFSNERETRAGISGIIMHAYVTYDMAKSTVSFSQLSYTPTYVWRGKRTDRTVHASLPSDVPPPDYVGSDQLTIMQRSFALVRDIMENTPLALRRPGNIFDGE